MAKSLASVGRTVALLLALAVALWLAALGRDTRAPTTPAAGGAPSTTQLDPRELARLSIALTPTVARRVERIRDLRFDRVPRPRLASTERLRRIAERALERPDARQSLRADEAGLRMLGLLDPAEDLEALASDFTALAAAFYDPRRDRLFVVRDTVPAGAALVEFILAHELTHALEDQRFGIGGGAGEGATDERSLARSALIEGTATAVMIDYARRHLDALELGAAVGAVDAGELPEFLEAQVTFSYFRGQDLVEHLYRRADGWALVDRALRRHPPSTSEQVLHPSAYLREEPALPVAASPAPGSGWRRLDDDLVGEFLTTQILRRSEQLVSESAASGWGGDRYQLWKRRGAARRCRGTCRQDHALRIAWRWQDRDAALEFLAALIAYATTGLGGHPGASGTLALDGGAAAISLAGAEVRLAMAPGARLAARLAGRRLVAFGTGRDRRPGEGAG